MNNGIMTHQQNK